MLKELLKNTEFLKIIENFLKNAEILDILLFGSATKGKENPNDIDLLVIYINSSREILDINYRLRKELKKININAEIIGKIYNDIFKPEFFAKESIFREGFSLKQKKFMSECFGYFSLVLLKYSLGSMNKSKRMQFYYSLYGRDKGGGILKKYGCHKFANTIMLSKVNNLELIKAFLEKWNIKFIEVPLLVSERFMKYVLK